MSDGLRDLARSLSGRGRTLEALTLLAKALDSAADPNAVAEDIRAISGFAIASFNAHLAAGDVEAATRYADALVQASPGNAALLGAALECNRNLGRWNEVAGYARSLVALDPNNVPANAALAEICKVTGDTTDEIGHRMALALSPDNPLHPMVRLRDLHDAASLILCHPLSAEAEARIETLQAAARGLDVGAAPGSEMDDWQKHYRLLLDAVDIGAIRAPAPPAQPDDPALTFHCAATGRAIGWDAVSAAAERLDAKCVFFAAADEAYVELYARWYALSVLKYCDVPCLIVVHVIGGADRLAAIAERVGVKDERLIYCGDRFDAAAVTTACHDAPPKGRAAKPLAHLQSVRFQRLGALIRHLDRPVFVSDIDLILQRGVADLLERCAEDDLVLNENDVSFNAGSRLTANLLLVNPTPNARLFVDFLAAFLDRALGGPAVTRWIDQLALLIARHHLLRHGVDPTIGYFDTASDINNVMYTSYQAHPFRFLSLYHGFDTSSLEGEAAVLG